MGKQQRKFPAKGFLSVLQQHPSHEQLTPHGLQLQHSQGMKLQQGLIINGIGIINFELEVIID